MASQCPHRSVLPLALLLFLRLLLLLPCLGSKTFLAMSTATRFSKACRFLRSRLLLLLHCCLRSFCQASETLGLDRPNPLCQKLHPLFRVPSSPRQSWAPRRSSRTFLGGSTSSARSSPRLFRDLCVRQRAVQALTCLIALLWIRCLRKTALRKNSIPRHHHLLLCGCHPLCSSRPHRRFLLLMSSSQCNVRSSLWSADSPRSSVWQRATAAASSRVPLLQAGASAIPALRPRPLRQHLFRGNPRCYRRHHLLVLRKKLLPLPFLNRLWRPFRAQSFCESDRLASHSLFRLTPSFAVRGRKLRGDHLVPRHPRQSLRWDSPCFFQVRLHESIFQQSLYLLTRVQSVTISASATSTKQSARTSSSTFLRFPLLRQIYQEELLPRTTSSSLLALALFAFKVVPISGLSNGCIFSLFLGEGRHSSGDG